MRPVRIGTPDACFCLQNLQIFYRKSHDIPCPVGNFVRSEHLEKLKRYAGGRLGAIGCDDVPVDDDGLIPYDSPEFGEHALPSPVTEMIGSCIPARENAAFRDRKSRDAYARNRPPEAVKIADQL